MGNIVEKLFRVVASKNVTDSLEDSVKEGNQAKFYLVQDGEADGKALDEVTIPDELSDRNALIINGNKIQGVSGDDLHKLNAIKDVNKIFKYKGSVKTGNELKAKVPPEAEVGDVWNVEQECEINGVKYPAHTNFVCSSIQILPATSTWDSLGGTMQMGEIATSVISTDNDTITFNTPRNTPIKEFSLVVSTFNGLYFDRSNSNILSLNLSTARDFWLGSSTVDDCIDLILSAGGAPVGTINIPIGIGLTVSTNSGISVKLSTVDDHIHINNPNHAIRSSGLDISTNGLFIAISSSGILNSQYIPDGLKCIEPNDTQKLSGGLILDGNTIAKWLQHHKGLELYINSLIDAKLKAQ